MGLNHLLHHHQLALMRSGDATSAPMRATHEERADGYARQIRAARLVTGGAPVSEPRVS